MTKTTPFPRFAAIVVAAGKGLRAGGDIPKQFATWRGIPLVRHSVETFLSIGAAEVLVAIPPASEDIAQSSLSGLSGYRLVTGGRTRQESVCNALQALADNSCERVLIHDAARPDIPDDVISGLLDMIDIYQGAIPVLPVV
ncbi:MAG: 2-C-methyl-D-erythritol 4-phosphate cytidylyltransferase, partial [Altererythrobacter ishigakiensis]|nr:2-C-methyl-D-erythritol 4-phosphate cytidylyltransferase [Altererythrobacter ishigakiensis]